MWFSAGSHEFGQCLLDAAHSLHDVLITGGVAHTDTLRRTERVAAYAGYVALLEEVHGEVRSGLDDLIAEFLSIVCTALGEEVEGTLRLVDLEAGDFATELYDEVAATLEGLAHLLYRLLSATVSGFGSLLRY